MTSFNLHHGVLRTSSRHCEQLMSEVVNLYALFCNSYLSSWPFRAPAYVNDNSVEFGIYIPILHFTNYGMWVVNFA